MASARVQGAAQGASIGGKIGGPVGAGIGAVAGAIFGGGRGTYAVDRGMRFVGNLTDSGFQGQIFGLAENAGTHYQDLLPTSHGAYALANEVIKQEFAAAGLGAGTSLPIDKKAGPDFRPEFKSVINDALARGAAESPRAGGALDALKAAFGGGAVQAPAIRYAAPGDPQAPQSGSGLVIAGNNKPAFGLEWLAFALGAFYVVKHV